MSEAVDGPAQVNSLLYVDGSFGGSQLASGAGSHARNSPAWACPGRSAWEPFLLGQSGSFYTALSSTIAPMCGPGGGPDVADHDVMMIRFDENWTYNPTTDAWTLSECPDVERYISGLDYDAGTFYVVHHATPRTWTCDPGGPTPGPGPGEIVWLRVQCTHCEGL